MSELANELGLKLTPEGEKAFAMLDKLADTVIDVGYFDGQTHESEDGEAPSLAQIAYWNHYGTLHKDGSVMIPPRPFMDALITHQDELSEFTAQALGALDTEEAVTSAIGAKAVDIIQNEITDGNWAPNAPITKEGGWLINEYGRNGPVPVHIKGKGEKAVLTDTGQLRQQIHFVVRKGSEGEE